MGKIKLYPQYPAEGKKASSVMSVEKGPGGSPGAGSVGATIAKDLSCSVRQRAVKMVLQDDVKEQAGSCKRRYFRDPDPTLSGLFRIVASTSN